MANDETVPHICEYCDTWMRTSLIPTALIRTLLIKYVKVEALLTQPGELDPATFAIDEALSTPAVTVYGSHDRSQAWVWLTTGDMAGAYWALVAFQCMTAFSEPLVVSELDYLWRRGIRHLELCDMSTLDDPLYMLTAMGSSDFRFAVFEKIDDGTRAKSAL
jgi:hypothetical protein